MIHPVNQHRGSVHLVLDQLAEFGFGEFPFSLTAKSLPLGSNSFATVGRLASIHPRHLLVRTLAPICHPKRVPEGVETRAAVVGQSEIALRN